jgi:molybdopterin synthase catalytic subunit
LPEANKPGNLIYGIMNGKYLISGPVTPALVASFTEVLGKEVHSGGHSLFLGQVRADLIDGKAVQAIEYSAYESMVEAEAVSIINSVLEEFPDARTVRIIHSTGIVRAGEISLLVLVSAGHRKHAMEACARTVELIKEKLPVWKKEIYNDDSHAWK